MNPRVFLTDFGLAKDTATGSRYTRTGTTLGTPAYMSPELARGEFAALTPASDVWAVGCVLYELLANRPAFEGDTPAAVIGLIVSGRTPPPGPGWPRAAGDVLGVCLRSRPEERYRNAGALRDDLDAAAAGQRTRRAPRTIRAWLIGAPLLAGALGLLVYATATTRGAGTAPSPAPTRADPLAAAWAIRIEQPRQALAALELALRDHPTRQDVRLALGAQQWALVGPDAAVTTWASVPSGTDEWVEAQWLTGVVRFAIGMHEDDVGAARDAQERWRTAAAGAGPAATWARAGLAMLAHDGPAARTGLDPSLHWSVAIVRGLFEGSEFGGDLQAGVRAYAQAIRNGPPLASLYLNRANLHAQLGALDAALTDFESALRFGLEPARVWNARGSAYERAGQFERALADLDAAIEARPDYVMALLNRAVLRLRQGPREAALPDLDRVLELEPNHAEARFNRGRLHQLAHRYAQALVDFDAAVRVRPADAVFLHYRGAMRERLGDLEGAAADYDLGLRHAPTRAALRMDRARLYVQAGDTKAGLAAMDQAVHDAPDLAGARFNRARLRRALGDVAGALEDAEISVELDPEDVDSLVLRATLRGETGDPTGALSDARTAVRLAPDNSEGWLALGLACVKTGALDDAANAFRTVLRLRPDAPAAPKLRRWLAEAGR